MTGSQDVSLHPDERAALLDQLFAVWRALEPDRFHCFSGSDADLVRAVRDARARQQAQVRSAARSAVALRDRDDARADVATDRDRDLRPRGRELDD